VLGSGESDNMSPRGASAWTGDAQGVYLVFKDGEPADSPRVLKATKVRFPVKFSELTFDLVTNREKHKDVLRNDVDIWFSHSIARPLKPGERIQLKEDLKEARQQESWERMSNDILDLVRRDPGKSRSHYERLPSAQGGVKGSQERKERAVASLLESGCLVRVELEKPVGRANHYLRVDEDTINSITKEKLTI